MVHFIYRIKAWVQGPSGPRPGDEGGSPLSDKQAEAFVRKLYKDAVRHRDAIESTQLQPAQRKSERLKLEHEKSKHKTSELSLLLAQARLASAKSAFESAQIEVRRSEPAYNALQAKRREEARSKPRPWYTRLISR